AEELDGLRVSVDILDPPEDIDGIEQLDPARYGIIVRADDGRQALLLPDLEGVDTALDQLRIVCRKGGLDPARDRYHMQRFRVTRHGRH
ncbi:MAG TPA: AMMECR1 domain-containing protein, partial [Thermoleophilia bacterium]|nr:AMMECR1 domain-containing protein [Thermoleophilia bacterium]